MDTWRETVERTMNTSKTTPKVDGLERAAEAKASPTWAKTGASRTQAEASHVRSHFGSSHYLFERAHDFSASLAFLWFCLVQVSVYNPVLLVLTCFHG